MNENIKYLKPKRYGRYRQGYINPKACKKIFSSINDQPIIYRSSYEKCFIEYCERSSDVLNWGSECIKIPYFFNRKWHIYWPDFLILDSSNKYWLIEIKPLNQTDVINTINESFQIGKIDLKTQTALKNLYKWDAAQKWCQKKGPNWSFRIITENDLNKIKL